MMKLGHTLQGRYRIVRPLGSGGFGAVYLAEDLRLAGRPVAIKHFSTSHLSAEEAAEMAVLFQSEAHTLARMRHPNLAQVFDYFQEGSDWFLIMEFVPGQTLHTLLTLAGQQLDEARVVDWAIELCGVLDYLHNQQPPLIFRDLKPSNVMLTPEGQLMLIDFGIVRSFKEGQAKDTFQMATPGYAPPEQFGGQTEPRSDLYALGATMYALLSGERPSGFSFQLPPLHEQAPHVSPELSALVSRAMAYSVQDRPPSALALRRSLEALRDERAASAARIDTVVTVRAVAPSSQPQARAGASQRRPRRWAPIFALAAVLLIGGAAVLIANRSLVGGAVQGVDSAGRPSPAPGQPVPGGSILVTPALAQGPGLAGVSLLVTIGPEGAEDIATLALADGVLQPLIADPANDSLASRALDGRVVFTRTISASEEHIFVAEPDGSSLRQLTSGPTLNRAGAWSPDGRRIAFESNLGSGSPRERAIYIMDADGGNLQRVTELPGWEGGPAWSPDGLQIAYHARSRSTDLFELWVVDLASGAVRQLASVSGQDLLWPSWSPDGGLIAFHAKRPRQNDAQIYLVPATGGEMLLAGVGRGPNHWARWSRDGSWLAFESQRAGFSQIYLYAPASGALWPLGPAGEPVRRPEW